MSRIFRITLLTILVLFSFACGLIANPVNQVKGLASTAEAVATSMPVTTLEALPSSMPNLSQYFKPVGKPVSDWNGIPIFPQASAGQEYNKNTYGFLTDSKVVDVHDYYQEKLKSLGWTSVTDTSNLIIAQKDKNVLEMNIVPGNSGTTVILILHQQ